MLIKFALNQITAREIGGRAAPKSPSAVRSFVHVCVCLRLGNTLDRVQLVAEGFIIFHRS